MTEPLIKLFSVIINELEAQLADRDAEIRRLQELINRLLPCAPTP